MPYFHNFLSELGVKLHRQHVQINYAASLCSLPAYFMQLELFYVFVHRSFCIIVWGVIIVKDGHLRTLVILMKFKEHTHTHKDQ